MSTYKIIELETKVISGFSKTDSLKIVLSNRKQYSYSSNSTINTKLEIFNQGAVSYLDNLECQLYFDYSGSYISVGSGITNRYGSYDFFIQSNIIPSNIKSFNAISKLIYKNTEYFSNIIKINIK